MDTPRRQRSGLEKQPWGKPTGRSLTQLQRQSSSSTAHALPSPGDPSPVGGIGFKLARLFTQLRWFEKPAVF